MTKAIDFKDPPVVEVVCEAAFGKLDAFKAPHIGAFWRVLPAKYSQVDELAPVPSAGDAVEILGTPPHPRSWFLTEDGRQLVQLQQDRIMYNWKLSDFEGEGRYPEFTRIFPEFLDLVGLFQKFVADERLGEIEFRQFSLTYVNHVPEKSVGGNLKRHSDVLIDHVRDTSRERFLPEPTGFNWLTQYDMPNGLGLLQVSGRSATKKDDERKQILRINLAARGVGADTSEEGMKAWFATAHDMIVHGFVDLTDQAVQNNVWGRKL